MTEQFIWAPKVLESFDAAGRGKILVVESDRTMDRTTPECVGWAVAFDNKLWRVIGCDRRMPMTPISIGETIGVSVQPLD